MDNNKRNIHSSGPLGMLIKSGQITKLDNTSTGVSDVNDGGMSMRSSTSYFKTQSGIEFSEQELVYIDPKECEPWQYANRQDAELGDLAALIESIKMNKQLQPALIRFHPTPHDGIKYEVIFGRRRHLACLQLGVPFLAIRKKIANIQDAIASQDAENKLRNDVSHFSNALLYRRLLQDGVFQSEKELAAKLNISTSTLNEIMAFAKIPEPFLNLIPNIHMLSKQLAVKIVQLINSHKNSTQMLIQLAPQIGLTINSLSKLERAFNQLVSQKQKHVNEHLAQGAPAAKIYTSSCGKKLFTFKYDYRGLPTIVLCKDLVSMVNMDEISEHLSKHIQQVIFQSEYSD